MNARFFEIFRQEFTHNLRRPLYWVLIALIGFFLWELSGGEASMGSGDARVGVLDDLQHRFWHRLVSSVEHQNHPFFSVLLSVCCVTRGSTR